MFDLSGRVVSHFGKVDILVNNVGGGASAPLENMSDEDWEHNMDLDLTAVFK